MTKKEKERAAAYIAGCFHDARLAYDDHDVEAECEAEERYKRFVKKLDELLFAKCDLLCLDFKKCYQKPIDEIHTMAKAIYAERYISA
jgi:hypothetical protein